MYTHTHTKCTYERTQSTSETMARQRLHGKPSLTPRISALLPVRCNPEGDTLRGQHPNRLSTRNDGYAQNNHNQQQLIAPSRQRAVQTTFAYLHWCEANPPSSRKLPALPRGRGSPKRGHFSAILAGFSEKLHSGRPRTRRIPTCHY